MTDFAAVETVWSDRLGSLRNVVRQHVIGCQVQAHLRGGERVLDVGCGQGTQAIRLASLGCEVTGVDPSEQLLATLRASAADAGVRVETLVATVETLADVLGGRRFDLVCLHGVLMYLDDAASALERVTGAVASGGLVSFTVRNGDALAYRPGIRGDYAGALKALDATTYVNELGAPARAHRRTEVAGWCSELGLEIEQWYGVRVLTDGLSADVVPDERTLSACLAAEVEAGRRDPYRRLASQLHFVARVP